MDCSRSHTCDIEAEDLENERELKARAVFLPVQHLDPHAPELELVVERAGPEGAVVEVEPLQQIPQRPHRDRVRVAGHLRPAGLEGCEV
eukprot:1280290-Rhodomonas_salina.3